MRVMVTNDDGDSPGLRALLRAAGTLGEAYAIIPNRQRSAVSGALTLHKPIRMHDVGGGIHAINGTPCDCVLFSLHSGEFKKPDLILSGINWGDNAGLEPLVGSGTLGACWQAAIEGVPAMAFSMERRGGDYRDPAAWGGIGRLEETVGRLIRELFPKCAPGKFLSVNIPFGAPDGAGVLWTGTLQGSRYATAITRRDDPDGNPYFWISGGTRKPDAGTDLDELMRGSITVTEVPLSLFGAGHNAKRP